MLAAGAILLLAGCGGLPKNVVILLDEPDGSASSVEIRTAGGTRVLSSAGEASDIGRGAAPPGEAFVPEAREVQTAFGEALAAEPPSPESFLLYFKSDTTNLTPESTALLPKIIAAIRRRAVVDISVVGHTDRFGDDGYNTSLSQSRATVIRDALIGSGIDAAAIDVAYHGENNPLIETPDEVREPRNRRVEVTIR